MGREAKAGTQGPAISRLTLLEVLRLEDNESVGDAGAEALAVAMRRLARLRALDLSCCGLGAAAAATLAQCLPPILGSLQDLSLDGNQIGREGAAALAAAPRGGQVTIYGMSRL